MLTAVLAGGPGGSGNLAPTDLRQEWCLANGGDSCPGNTGDEGFLELELEFDESQVVLLDEEYTPESRLSLEDNVCQVLDASFKE